ncbi:MAG TPA: TonB family protein [Vicinamibacterales bacterium]|nr:TonB family protein [Vicinamibacterales bacterium]
MDAVSEVLRTRMNEPDGFRRMLGISLTVHATAILVLALLPMAWIGYQDRSPKVVMNITLGGNAPGPYTGGMQTLGGRPVQAVAPLPKAPTAVRPPAEKTPEMTVPERRPVTKPKPEVKTAPEKTRTWNRQPLTGEKVQAGSSTAETGATGQGFGLSTGGGGTGGYLDVKDFCCPGYIATMDQLIRTNWQARQEVPGEAMIKFTIERTGVVTDVQLERSSGYLALDMAAQRAVMDTHQLPPLPAEFPNPTLTVHLNFQYQQQPR